MKKVVIFDNYYDESDELEKDVNEWIEENNVNIIDIEVITENMGQIEYEGFNAFKNRDEKHIENNIIWYAVITYEE